MKRLPLDLITALSLVLASTAVARIGETKQQIEARYREPIGPRGSWYGVEIQKFKSAGMLITVSFIDDRSEAEVYQRLDETSLSVLEIKALLAANSDGKQWEQASSEDFVGHSWSRQGAVAGYAQSSRPPSLAVMSSLYVDHLKTTERSEEERLRGF